MNPTTEYILKRFDLDYKGCICKHLPEQHVHEVKECTICNCERYKGALPLEIPNFGRDNLPQLFRELGYTKGAEIGVCQGDYSQVLLKGYPELRLYMVDPWKPYPGYFMGDEQKMEKLYNRARRRTAKYKRKLIRKFSVDAAKDFADKSLDFCFIDAGHDFVNVVNDLAAWEPKVRSGGILAGHDYIQRGMGPTVFGKANKSFHVKQAVLGYTSAFLQDPWFVLGRAKPQDGEIRDSIRSFMWVVD